MNSVGIEDFFYIADRSYDYLAEKSLPSYHEAHEILTHLVDEDKKKELNVLDLGIGSGVTSAYILKNYPNALIHGIDLSADMIEDAKERLSRFDDRISFFEADNSQFLEKLDNSFDVIVSAFCIHHLDESSKQELFGLIHDNLRPGGRFLMLDLTTFNCEFVKLSARKATISHMESNVKDKQYRANWIHHWNNINIPSPADDMVAWLKDVGFVTSEIVFRNLEVVLISANKG